MIHHHLIHIRTIAGLTQKELAEMLETSTGNVTHIETGRNKVDFHADKLAEIYGCTVHDIFALGIDRKYGDSKKTVSEQAKEYIISLIFTNNVKK